MLVFVEQKKHTLRYSSLMFNVALDDVRVLEHATIKVDIRVLCFVCPKTIIHLAIGSI